MAIDLAELLGTWDQERRQARVDEALGVAAAALDDIFAVQRALEPAEGFPVDDLLLCLDDLGGIGDATTDADTAEEIAVLLARLSESVEQLRPVLAALDEIAGILRFANPDADREIISKASLEG